MELGVSDMYFYSSFNDLYNSQRSTAIHNYVWQNYGFYGKPESQTIWLDTGEQEGEEVCSVSIADNRVPYEEGGYPLDEHCSVCVGKINKKYVGLVKRAVDELCGDSSSLWSNGVMDGITPVEMSFAFKVNRGKASQLAWELDTKVKDLYQTMPKREQKRGMFK